MRHSRWRTSSSPQAALAGVLSLIVLLALVVPVSLSYGIAAAAPPASASATGTAAGDATRVEKRCRKVNKRFGQGVAKSKRAAKRYAKRGNLKPKVSKVAYRKLRSRDSDRDGVICGVVAGSSGGTLRAEPGTSKPDEPSRSSGETGGEADGSGEPGAAAGDTAANEPVPTDPAPETFLLVPDVFTSLSAESTTRATSAGLTVSVVNHNPDFADNQVWTSVTGNGATAPERRLSERQVVTLDQVSSGRVWVTLGAPLDSSTFPSPDNSQIRFDAVELTYPGVANLSAVDMLGIPMDIETFDSAGRPVAAKRWACYTDVVMREARARLAGAGGDFERIVRRDGDGNFLRLVSPNIVSGAHPSGYPRFDDYIESILGQELTIRGHALGKEYHYTGSFAADPSDPAGPGSITLRDQGPDHLPDMYVSGSSLAGNSSNDTNGIYGNNSPYYVGGELSSGNDVYGAVYRDLTAGFAYGFWGSESYGNDSANFDVSATPGPFEHAQPDHPYYNIWAATLWPLTQAYGFPYGDTYNDHEDRNP
ncbi:MAG: hypothetical protein KDC39_15040, partial [Actinobacteria bacterium]|nr:hypothetical protein [Actinomycetota bacterium]